MSPNPYLAAILMLAFSIAAIWANLKSRRFWINPLDWSAHASRVFGALLLLYLPAGAGCWLQWKFQPWGAEAFVAFPLLVLGSYCAGLLAFQNLPHSARKSPIVQLAGLAPVLGAIVLVLLQAQGSDGKDSQPRGE